MTQQQPARTDLYDALDQSWYRWGPPGTPKTDSLNRLIDAHAAEVRAAALREAADAIDARQNKLDAEIRAEYGELDRDTELEGAATRSMAAHLRRMAEEARS
ncbi:hypothetical protein [Streptomyces sp. NPDC058664]|uniref:hypothetical protein n=1 Tax=unclassified Streptomyces TaxID=2593676 RepID=UPI003665CAE6